MEHLSAFPWSARVRLPCPPVSPLHPTPARTRHSAPSGDQGCAPCMCSCAHAGGGARGDPARSPPSRTVRPFAHRRWDTIPSGLSSARARLHLPDCRWLRAVRQRENMKSVAVSSLRPPHGRAVGGSFHSVLVSSRNGRARAALPGGFLIFPRLCFALRGLVIYFCRGHGVIVRLSGHCCGTCLLRFHSAICK